MGPTGTVHREAQERAESGVGTRARACVPLLRGLIAFVALVAPLSVAAQEGREVHRPAPDRSRSDRPVKGSAETAAGVRFELESERLDA